jgi:hypothetical protein
MVSIQGFAKLFIEEMYMQSWEAMDVDIVRAIQLWYSLAVAELVIDLKPKENKYHLGVGISCTKEVHFITLYL